MQENTYFESYQGKDGYVLCEEVIPVKKMVEITEWKPKKSLSEN